MAERYYEGIGRRKAASARVRVTAGSGQFMVNEKTLEEFFTRSGDKEAILGPMMDSGTRSALEVSVKVQGGGVTTCKLDRSIPLHLLYLPIPTRSRNEWLNPLARFLLKEPGQWSTPALRLYGSYNVMCSAV